MFEPYMCCDLFLSHQVYNNMQNIYHLAYMLFAYLSSSSILPLTFNTRGCILCNNKNFLFCCIPKAQNTKQVLDTYLLNETIKYNCLYAQC